MQRFAEVFSDGPFKRLDKLVDAKLHTEDGATFPVHRVQLAMRNLYFKSMFCGNFSRNTEVLIKGVNENTMGYLLYFLYTNNVSLDRDNVMDIWIASDYLLVDSLKELCRSFVLKELDDDNCLGVFLTVWKIEGLGLIDECFRYLVVHFKDIIQECFTPCRNTSERATLDVLRDFPYEALKKILESSSLNVTDERTVWEVIVAWFGLDYLKKQQYFPKLLNCIHKENMDEALSTAIQDNPIVKHNPVWNKHSEPEISGMLRETYNSGSRTPPNLHFVAHYCMLGNSFYLDLYLTFDHKLDTWRKLATNVALCPDFLVQIGFNIYMFDAWENKILAFNMLDCSRSAIPPINTDRSRYSVVSVADQIYVLGGATADFEDTDVIERYDPTRNAWDVITPMHPMILSEVVAMNGCIYAIGDIGGEPNPSMMVQVYNPESDLWYVVDAPKYFRHDFTAVVYSGLLYVIGGEGQDSISLRNAEEYNPDVGTWNTLPDLPFIYVLPKAIELEDRLVVFENHLENRRLSGTSPPVFWDSDERKWEIVEESCPLYNVHLYQFCTINQPKIVKDLVKQNRLSDNEWIRSCLV